jgi:hypothetical protein
MAVIGNPGPTAQLQVDAAVSSYGAIHVAVFNYTPDVTYDVTVDNLTTVFGEIVLDDLGQGAATVPLGIADGNHSLHVGALSAPFVSTGAPGADPADPTAVAYAPPTHGPVTKWAFQDPASGVTYTFAINPDPTQPGSPGSDRVFDTTASLAPDGQMLVSEGSRIPSVWTFGGTVLTQADYEALQQWADKNYRVYLVDDLGVVRVVLPQVFSPRPVGDPSNGWAHTYTFQVLVLEVL